MKDLSRFLSHLACPLCRDPLRLSEDGRSAVCEGGHLFDFAKEGYLNLFPSRPSGGDDADCVRARRTFLDTGLYAPIADEVTRAAASARTVIDAGCGEGYYTSRLAMANPGSCVIGFDLSKAAVSLAARRERAKSGGAYFGVASVFALPVRDACADAVTNLFAPVAEEEYARLLAPGGQLIVAAAGEDHLLGLKAALYDHPYKNEGRRDLPGTYFKETERRHVRFDMRVEGNENVRALFAMTPYFYRTSPEDRARLDAIDVLKTPVDVTVYMYTKE